MAEVIKEEHTESIPEVISKENEDELGLKTGLIIVGLGASLLAFKFAPMLKKDAEAKLNTGMLLGGLGVSMVAFTASPAIIGMFRKLWDNLKVIEWTKLRAHQYAVLGFLASAQIVPYFLFIFKWYIEKVKEGQAAEKK